jgi:polysaccharide biosynthesis/export protein
MAAKSPLFGQTPIGAQPGATEPRIQGSLPYQKLGPDDLIGVSVYSAPELSGNVRLRADGTITLPMLKEPIKVAEMYPSEVSSAIAEALRKANILVNPVVTVSVVEYRSRPIAVIGAVRKPLTFQETGTMTLLDALSMCEGLSDDAGPDILVTENQNVSGKPTRVTRRISVKALMSGTDPSLNISLNGGEEIRVPQAGNVYVVGSVKKPGVFPVRETAHSSVLRALAVSEGLLPFAGQTAYIYRRQDAQTAANEIPVELKKITDRKSPDVPLLPGDVLYVPDRSGRRNFAAVMQRVLIMSTGLGSAALYVYH